MSTVSPSYPSFDSHDDVNPTGFSLRLHFADFRANLGISRLRRGRIRPGSSIAGAISREYVAITQQRPFA